jgi:outer membrane murein-binding lipoprotein Lpp
MKQQMLEAEVKELKAHIEALTVERDKWREAHGQACAYWHKLFRYEIAQTQAAEADSARLRDALDRVVAEYDLQMYGPAISSIDVARAALNHGKETK